jgi:iron-sulfur cluster insertion protein
MAHNFSISESAATRINKIVSGQSYVGKRLRISVEGGGCSGFKYNISFDDFVSGKDMLFSHNNAQVVIDDISLDFLENSVLDFIEDLGGASFEIKNPNASAKCGCGKSFAI